MKMLRTFSHLWLVVLLVSHCLGAPFSDDDDEYDDDPELPVRKETILKIQEKLQAYHDQSTSTTTTTTTTEKPNKGLQLIDFPNRPEEWTQALHARGYVILSSGPVVKTQVVRTRPMLRITIPLDDDNVRDVEKSINRRSVDLYIRSWNKIHKVHVKVPRGYEPQDLRIAEGPKHIDIIAPIIPDYDEHE